MRRWYSCWCRGDKVSGMATTKYQRHRFFSWIVNTVDGIWLNREELDVDASVCGVVRYLQGGWMLGIAPGWDTQPHRRPDTGQDRGGIPGGKAGVPVIPVAIIGTAEVTRMLRRLRRPIITVEFGPALHLPPAGGATCDADLERNTDEIMCQLAAWGPGPEELRGVYAQHPRTWSCWRSWEDKNQPSSVVSALSAFDLTALTDRELSQIIRNNRNPQKRRRRKVGQPRAAGKKRTPGRTARERRGRDWNPARWKVVEVPS